MGCSVMEAGFSLGGVGEEMGPGDREGRMNEWWSLPLGLDTVMHAQIYP
jgi:hypothetical protein